MRNILILELLSSSINYIDDATNRGYQPVVFYYKPGKSHSTHVDLECYENVQLYKNKIKAYQITDDYEKTLKLAKKINPVCILQCTDGTTYLREKLCADLKLPKNSLKYANCYFQKFPMQDALRKYGIRYIRSKVIHSVEEGLDFYDKENLKSCVIKQTSGAASFGLHICDNKDLLVKYLKMEFENTDCYTGKKCSELLIQEKINGTEYIVNTLSINGDHNLLSYWRYNKKPGKDNSYVYDYAENMYKLESGSYQLIKYAYDVLDAIHYKNGPVHGEYMVDENGPVLIEVNCRAMGGNMPPGFLDAAHGHHETDVILNDLLSPGYHKLYKDMPYYPLSKVAIKLFISKADSKIISIPADNLLKHLDSYFGLTHSVKKNTKIKSTVDLFTSPGTILLVNKDEPKLSKDLDFVCRLENTDFELLYQTKKANIKDKPKNMETIKKIIKEFCPYGSTIVLSNNSELKIDKPVVNEKTVKNVRSGFLNAIFDYEYSDKFNLPNYIDAFFDFVNCVKKGGQILVPERSYWFLDKKETSIEFLFECAGLEISAYKNDNCDVLTAYKL